MTAELPPWQVVRSVVLWRCLRCDTAWLPGRWWADGAALRSRPRECPGCGSGAWWRLRSERDGPSKHDILMAEVAARKARE